MPEEEHEPQKPIENLGKAGLALWNEVTEDNELRPDELRLLSSACRISDHIEAIEQALIGQSLIVRGSQGQPVAQPLLAELRQYRSTQATLFRQLNLPDDDEDDEPDGSKSRSGPMSRTDSARHAATTRWERAKKGKK